MARLPPNLSFSESSVLVFSCSTGVVIVCVHTSYLAPNTYERCTQLSRPRKREIASLHGTKGGGNMATSIASPQDLDDIHGFRLVLCSDDPLVLLVAKQAIGGQRVFFVLLRPALMVSSSQRASR